MKNATHNGKDSRRKVLLAFDWRYTAIRRYAAGILRFAQQSANWEVELCGNLSENESLVFKSQCHPDGIISGYKDATYFPHPYLASARHRVFLCDGGGPLHAARSRWVLADNQAIGRRAAKFFIDKRYENFAFFGSLNAEIWSDQRQRGFIEKLRDAGLCAKCLISRRGRKTPYDIKLRDLANKIALLPKPCAIFAACDQGARIVLDACRTCGLSVPSQIAVLGVDNEDYFCEFASPPLSSIEPAFEEGGFLAAKTLDAMMRGEHVPDRPIRFGMVGLIERKSTADENGVRRTVSAVRELIRKNVAVKDLSVRSIANSMHCSTRYLEKCFRAATESTLVEEIRAARLAQVCRLLTTTSMTTESIAVLSGFSNPVYMKRLFVRKFGMTPLNWRAKPHPSATLRR